MRPQYIQTAQLRLLFLHKKEEGGGARTVPMIHAVSEGSPGRDPAEVVEQTSGSIRATKPGQGAGPTARDRNPGEALWQPDFPGPDQRHAEGRAAGLEMVGWCLGERPAAARWGCPGPAQDEDRSTTDQAGPGTEQDDQQKENTAACWEESDLIFPNMRGKFENW